VTPDFLVGAMDGLLELAEHGVDPGEFLLSPVRWRGPIVDPPARTGLYDDTESSQPVRVQLGIGRHMPAGLAVNRGAAKALQRRRAHLLQMQINAKTHRRDHRVFRRWTGRARMRRESVPCFSRASSHRQHGLTLAPPRGLRTCSKGATKSRLI